jgi:hypothetical protein
MRKLLVLMLVVFLTLSCTAISFAAPFTDLPAKHWAYEAVDKLVKANLIEGYSDGTFRGDKSMSRYEIAFMTARAIERYDQANVQQKTIIDKLSSEFAAELNKMGLRIAKVEAKTNSWVTGGDMRFRYHWNDPKTPGGSALRGADQFDWRGRVRFTGTLSERWTANARITSPWSNRAGNSDGNPGASASFDIFNMRGTNVLGLDSFKVGRDWYLLGNGIINKSAAVDGIWTSKKLGDTNFNFFVGNVKSYTTTLTASADTGNANTFTSAEFSRKLDKSLKVGAAYYLSDMKGSSTGGSYNYGNLNANNGAAFDRSQGYVLSFSKEFSGLTLIGDYVASTLDNPRNIKGSPKGWFAQLSNGTGPSAKAVFGNTPMVNIKKVGDFAWLVGYRRIESGATPPDLGGFDQVAVASTAQQYNVFMHGTDNVKGWMVSLETVPDKNITVNLTLQDLSIVNRAMATNLTRDKLDTTAVLTFNYWF